MSRMKVVVIAGLLGFASAAGCSEEEPAAQNEPESADDDGEDDDKDDDVRSDASASTGTSRDGGAGGRDAARPSSGEDAAAGRDAAALIDAASTTSDASQEPARDAARADAMTAADAAEGSAFSLRSSVVQSGMRLANEHRCADMQNENVSPPLEWSEGPTGTLSYALVMRDITRGVILHWTLYDLPATTTSLPADVPPGYQPAELNGAKQGPSYKSALGYQGPCAPSGTNTYEFTIYAIDVATIPGLTQSSSAAQIVSAIEQHDLASAKLAVTSSRM